MLTDLLESSKVFGPNGSGELIISKICKYVVCPFTLIRQMRQRLVEQVTFQTINKILDAKLARDTDPYPLAGRL